MPASFMADRIASSPISIADLPGNRPNGCRPTPMIATSSIGSSLRRSSRGRGGRGEGVDHDLVPVVIDAERDHGQLPVLSDLRLAPLEAGQVGLDEQLV